MELPPYRVPTMRATLSHMWDRCAQYLRKMGGLILIASVAVWFLSYYPTPDAAAPAETTEEHYENSYLGQVGQACSPVFEPLGLNWKASIAILTGLPAKEIVVSTLGVLYSEQGDAPEAELDSPTLSQRLVASGDFTPASALAFLVFILLYLPCIATIVAIAAEIGWRRTYHLGSHIRPDGMQQVGTGRKNKHSSYGNPRRRIENRICGNRHIDVAIQFL